MQSHAPSVIDALILIEHIEVVHAIKPVPEFDWLERLVVRVVLGCQLPEYRELVDGSVLDATLLAVELDCHDVAEGLGETDVELLQELNHLNVV